MSESFDLYDKNNQPLGKICSRQEAHQKGFWHRTIHLWIFHPEQGLLWQKRAKNKDTNPGYWDLSVAGHLSAGETLMEALQKEASEEAGLQALHGIHHLGVISQEFVDPLTKANDKEHQYVYLTTTDQEISTFVPQPSEVECFTFFPVEFLMDWPKEYGTRVDHSQEYTLVYEFLKNRKNLVGFEEIPH